MQKQFLIHPSLDGVRQLADTLGYMLILICWIVPLMLQGPFVFYRPQLSRIAIYITFTILFMLHLGHIAFSSLKATVYILTENGLIRRTPHKQTTVNFSETVAFRYIHAPFGFGFGHIRSADKRIPLPFLINDCAALVSAIHASLIREGRHSACNDNEIRLFVHHARIAAFHLAHTAALLPSLLSFMVFSLVINTFTALFIWSIPLPFSLLWIIISIIMPCIGFIAGHTIINRKISRQLLEAPDTPPAYDASSVYLMSLFFAVIAFLTIGILYKQNWELLIK